MQIVPLGHNVDEIIHFAHTKLVAAGCLRDSVGLSWSLHNEDSLIGEDVTEWIAFNNEEITMVDPASLTSAPCQLLFDDRRLTNAAYYIWAGIPMAIFNGLSDRNTINLGRFVVMSDVTQFKEFKEFCYMGHIGEGLKWVQNNKQSAKEIVLKGQNYVERNYSKEKITGLWRNAIYN